jgi:hypothetical protein
MPSLEFNSVELLRVAWQASAEADVDYVTRGASALTSASLTAVVFSAAAVEAFTNDLADHVEVWREATSFDTAVWDRAPWAFNPYTPELIRAVADMVTIDASRQGNQLESKVRAAIRALANDPKQSDGREIQDLARLIVLRDAIMHARAPRPQPRPGLEEVLRDLARDGIAVPTSSGTSASAFLRMQSPRLARWAYRTAYTVIQAMLGLVPIDVDSVQSLRDMLRNPVKIPPPR